MNVSADLMMKLARACTAPVDANAEGVVRQAIERLSGDREWWVEVFDEKESVWEFHSIAGSAAAAKAYAKDLGDRWNRKYRAVELIRRVLPP